MRTITKLSALAAISLLAIAAPVLAQNATADTKSESTYDAKDNGGYVAKQKVESTDTAGTTVEHTKVKKLNVDSNGNAEKTVDEKTSTDPKGLFNKTSTEVKDTAKEKNGQIDYTHKKTVNGKTVEEKEDQKTQAQ